MQGGVAAAATACRLLPGPAPNTPTLACGGWESVARVSERVPRSCCCCARPAAGPVSAPSLSDGEQPSTSGRPPAGGPPPEPKGPSPLRQAWRQTLRGLSNLQLAIGELALIGLLSSVGTVIKQGEPYSYYAEVLRCVALWGGCVCGAGWAAHALAPARACWPASSPQPLAQPPPATHPPTHTHHPHQQNYPEEGRKVLGFLTGRLIWALQWDHIYSADYFLLLLALLGASLAACTATNQWPAVKVARRWRFRGDAQALGRLPVSAQLPNAAVADVARALAVRQYQVRAARRRCGAVGMHHGWCCRGCCISRRHVSPTPSPPLSHPRMHQVFLKDGQLYGFKGLAGKLGPIGVHASMLLCMAGFALGARELGAAAATRGCCCRCCIVRLPALLHHAALTCSPRRHPLLPAPCPAVASWNGTVMVPEGDDVVVASVLRSASPLAWYPAGASAVLHCDDFRIDYRPDGSVRQFYSDMSGALCFRGAGLG